MKTKSDDIKLLAEAYGKIYAEQYDDEDEESYYVNPESNSVYIVYDVGESGEDAIHRVFATLVAASDELEAINGQAGYMRWDILEMPVE